MQCCRVLINFLNLGVLESSWPKFTHKVLPTLVRMCKSDCHPKHRIEAALLIYQLTQSSAELQMSAIITERLVAVLLKYLALKSDSNCTVSCFLCTSCEQTESDRCVVIPELSILEMYIFEKTKYRKIYFGRVLLTTNSMSGFDQVGATLKKSLAQSMLRF